MSSIPSIQEAEAGGALSFEARLVYRVSSRTARATQRNPILKKKKRKRKTKQTKTQTNKQTNKKCTKPQKVSIFTQWKGSYYIALHSRDPDLVNSDISLPECLGGTRTKTAGGRGIKAQGRTSWSVSRGRMDGPAQLSGKDGHASHVLQRSIAEGGHMYERIDRGRAHV
jgi:hypothetical protein